MRVIDSSNHSMTIGNTQYNVSIVSCDTRHLKLSFPFIKRVTHYHVEVGVAGNESLFQFIFNHRPKESDIKSAIEQDISSFNSASSFQGV